MDRRNFLAATTTLGLSSLAHASFRRLPELPLPATSLFQQDEERYWSDIRKQFLIPADEVYLNNGTVGSSPRPVLNAIFDGYNKTEQMADDDPEHYPIWGYESYNEFRDPLAKFLGADRDEIALLRNATEANSYISQGLEMKAGDEVLMSDQEHPGGKQGWLLRAKRYGIAVKEFQIPKPPKNGAEILNLINDAITPRTRIIFVSHATTVSGVVLPAKEIAALARTKGILSAFDGAHIPGMMKLNIHDIGCDMYTASPHKWLMAPKGSGFLYVREEVQPRLWNTIVTAGWNQPELKAERFQRIGSSNVPNLWGLRAAIDLCNQIGLERIERRHRQMSDYLFGEMMKRGAVSVTSPDPTMRCAISSVDVPPIKRMELEHWMWTTHKIRIRGHEPSNLRLSTPYYLLRSDIDRFLAAFDEYKKTHAA
jgi:selenocysteine lyase/cysteine desulfurase